MDKVFEALEDLKNYLFNKWKQNHINFGCNYKLEAELEKQLKNLDPIKQALTELKAIKEAKPSEALECVDILKEDGCITTLYQGKALETIRQYILKAQENEKVLEIVKKKDVDIYILKNCKTVDEYNFKIVHIVGETRELTEEEFELVKRWNNV